MQVKKKFSEKKKQGWGGGVFLQELLFQNPNGISKYK